MHLQTPQKAKVVRLGKRFADLPAQDIFTSRIIAMAKRKKTAIKKKSATAAKKGPKKGPKRRKAAKRELIDTGRDKRFVRRGDGGQFNESDDVGRSLSQDRRRKAKRSAKPGQGDKGDRAPRKKK
jgi:hypothetical protein